jgi:ABC-type oligopeptide transport system substrate-binding subunit
MNNELSTIEFLSRQRLPILACIAMLMAACGGSQDAQRDSVLNRGMFTEPESLDTHKARSLQAGDVQRDLGEGLTGYAADGAFILAAAERMEMSDDGLTYTFWLRSDGRWSNGDRVTAEDFVYSFRRLVDPATAAFYAQDSLGDVVNAMAIIAGEKSVEALAVAAVSELQLQITLEQPVPYFDLLLTHQSTFPVHRGSIEEHGDEHARPGSLVSNGAYRLDAWEVGSYIEVSCNEHYWNDAETAIDRVRHHIVPEDTVELNRYRAGELEITASVPSEAFEKMKQERPGELRVSPYLAVYYYGFNLTRPPFKDNPKLRQALSMAIDRETITDVVIGRGETPAYGWVPPGTSNYESQQFPYAKLSRQQRHLRARELFAEAGFGAHNPLRVELRYNTSDAHKNMRPLCSRCGARRLAWRQT